MKNFWKIALAAFIGVLVATFFLVLLGLGAIGSLASLGNETPAVPAGNFILKISGTVTEQKSENVNFNPLTSEVDISNSTGILNVVRAIDQAAQDPAVKLIYIRPDEMSIRLACAEELRAALVRFRDSGKPIIAYSDIMDTGMYYIASVADKVILNPYADVMLSGVSIANFYFKDLIDKLGIDIQLIRHGKYKSAGEPYIKNAMSPENREQYECMIGAMWNTIADGVAQNRDFTRDDFCGWVDNLEIGNASDAKAKGLVDELWFKDELEDYLCGLLEVDTPDDLQLTGIANYAAVKVKPNIRTKEKIAVIYADGEIVMGDNAAGYIGDNFAREIAKVRKDSTVKAVVFRVNSPGGSVQASAIIRHEIELLKKEKPVVASYGDYAASGGYWISCGCDKIFSNRATLTGSIGVFGLLPSFGNALKKNLHINVETVSTNSHGAMIDGLNPLDEQEVAWMQNMIESTYTEFTGIVAEGRGMSREAVDNIGQGRVWAGDNAIGIGLVDEIGTLQDAVNYAASMVDLENYQLVEYPAAMSTMDRLMKMFNKKSASLDVLPEPLDKIADEVKYYVSIDRPTVMARMECVPQICTK